MNMFFPKRIPEPKAMEEIEMKVFEELTLQNYKRWLIPFVDEALTVSKIKKGEILDIGCGPGLLAKEFASRSAKFFVKGIDTSPEAIKMAKKHCKSLRNTDFVVGDASSLPFPESSFNLVVCKDSLHHFGDIKKALKEMKRVLKPNGILYIQDMRRDLPFYLLKRSMPPDTTLKKLQFYSTRAAYTKDEIAKILKNSGISRFQIKTRKLTDTLTKKYKRIDININQLKEGFQARYVISAKK